MDNTFPPKPEIPIARERSRVQLMFGAGFMVVTALVFLLDAHSSLWLLLMLALSFLVHEAGHVLALLALRTSNIQVLNLPIMRLSGSKPLSQRGYWLAILSGPAFGLFAGGLCLYLGKELDQNLLLLGGTCSVAFSVITLLPVDLSDGGDFLVDALMKESEQGKFIFSFLSSVGIIILGILIWWWPLIILGFLLIFRVKQVRQVKDIRLALQDQDVEYRVTYDQLSDEGYWRIRDAYVDRVPALKEILPGMRTVWDNEHLLIRQVQSILSPTFLPMAGNLAKVIAVCAWSLVLATSVWLLAQPWSNSLFDVLQDW